MTTVSRGNQRITRCYSSSPSLYCFSLLDKGLPPLVTYLYLQQKMYCKWLWPPLPLCCFSWSPFSEYTSVCHSHMQKLSKFFSFSVWFTGHLLSVCPLSFSLCHSLSFPQPCCRLLNLTYHLPLPVCVCVCVCTRACVCLCQCLCVSVWLCVCVFSISVSTDCVHWMECKGSTAKSTNIDTWTHNQKCSAAGQYCSSIHPRVISVMFIVLPWCYSIDHLVWSC